MIYMEPAPGERIDRLVWKMVRIANWTNQKVLTLFNDKEVEVNPGDKQSDVIDSYSDVKNFDRNT